jgi:hypothetical protein
MGIRITNHLREHTHYPSNGLCGMRRPYEMMGGDK